MKVIKIDPALPCGIIGEKNICGKPSTVAHVYKLNGHSKGEWIILPVCKDCSLKAIESYK